MNTLELILYRHTANTKPDRNIIGDLHIANKFFSFTLEDEIRQQGVKVYGKTCIDAGRYKVIVTYSPKFKKYLPLLLNVPRFKYIRMHNGVHSGHTLGCVLTGFKTDGNKIWGKADEVLTKRLQQHDGDIYITIRNTFLTYDKELKINK